MQDSCVSTSSVALTQRSIPWTDEELERLRQFAEVPAIKGALEAAFPGRTLGAIRVQLSHLRREAGIPRSREGAAFPTLGPTMLDPADEGLRSNWQDAERIKNAEADRRYLTALMQMAALS